MACYKELFTKKGLIKNIASYLIIPILIFHIIVFIIFYIKEKIILDNKIKDISYAIKNWDLVVKDETEKKKKKK